MSFYVILNHPFPPFHLSTFPPFRIPQFFCAPSASPRWRLARALRFFSSRSKRRFSACALAVDKSASGEVSATNLSACSPERTEKNANTKDRVPFETGLSPLDTKDKIGQANDPLIAVLKLMYGKETSQYTNSEHYSDNLSAPTAVSLVGSRKPGRVLYQRELLVRIY